MTSQSEPNTEPPSRWSSPPHRRRRAHPAARTRKAVAIGAGAAFVAVAGITAVQAQSSTPGSATSTAASAVTSAAGGNSAATNSNDDSAAVTTTWAAQGSSYTPTNTVATSHGS